MLDRATLGHPGKFGYCLAEDEEGSDWTPLAQLRGAPAGVSAVTVLAAGAPRQIMNEWTTVPEEILETFAAEMRANMLHYSIWGGNYAIVVPKQLRDRLQDAGWSKRDVQQFLFERARVRKKDWTRVGKGALVTVTNGDDEHAALPSPTDLLVIAAGGPAGGFGAVIPPWFGHKSRAVTTGSRRLLRLLSNCTSCTSSIPRPRPIRSPSAELRVSTRCTTAASVFCRTARPPSSPLFDHLEWLLRQEWKADDVLRLTKGNYSAPAEPDLIRELARCH